MVTAPDLTPLSLGLKATRIVQLSPAGKLEPQLSITSKSPLAPMLKMLKVVGPVFVSVAVCAALRVPTNWSGKVRLVVDSAATGGGV